ncbi:hypothetical protein HYS54_05065 [Candidatus Micrarchaeota archaeon]|nr:hypothetical protein [Candidatus Micrarchaeota archaeon]
MAEMVTIQLPKKDVESLLHIVEDLRFLEAAEKGNGEISAGKFKTLKQVRAKYGIQS